MWYSIDGHLAFNIVDAKSNRLYGGLSRRRNSATFTGKEEYAQACGTDCVQNVREVSTQHRSEALISPLVVLEGSMSLHG